MGLLHQENSEVWKGESDRSTEMGMDQGESEGRRLEAAPAQVGGKTGLNLGRLERRGRQLGKTQHPKQQESTHSHLLRTKGTAEKLRRVDRSGREALGVCVKAKNYPYSQWGGHKHRDQRRGGNLFPSSLLEFLAGLTSN